MINYIVKLFKNKTYNWATKHKYHTIKEWAWLSESDKTVVAMSSILQLLGYNAGCPWPIHFSSKAIHPERISLGADAWRNFVRSPGCYYQAFNGIQVGEGTLWGPGVGLISANHKKDDLSSWEITNPISIGSNCWIGMNAIVLPGVTIGDNVIIGAGSTVTKSVDSNSIVYGVAGKMMTRQNPKNL